MHLEDPFERQEKIKDLLSKRLISNQKMIVHLLEEIYQIKTNQAVVSRDLRKLGVVKKNRNGILVYELSDNDVQSEILQLALVDVIYNEVMIIAKTHPGLAAFVGDWLDRNPDLEIIGCLAGENVVFIVPESIKNIRKIYQDICQKLHFTKEKVSNV